MTPPMNSLPASDLEAWDLGTAIPTYATSPTPGACHELELVEKVAEALGTPLLPWQRYVTRVATELNDDGSYRYPLVMVTVPRQSGKTTLIRALFLARCLKYRRRNFAVFAQTGKDARQRLMDLADQVEDAVFSRLIKINRGQTNPSVTCTKTHSRVLSFAPTAESTHGWTFDGALLDELFAFEEAQAEQVMGAIIPAMATKRHHQTFLVSTKGTMASIYLNRQIERGRDAVTDPEALTAFFEWSMPAGLDGYDPASWGFHPGVAAGLIGPSVIQSAAGDLSEGEFMRAFMNITTAQAESVLSLDKWRDQAGALPDPVARDLCIGYEVAKDGKRAAIVAAWRGTDDRINARLIASKPGTYWMKPTLLELARARPRALGADRVQQNTVVHDSIIRDNPRWDRYFSTLTAGEWATSCAGFKQAFDAGRLRHDSDDLMARAIMGATTRPLGPDSWKFSHDSPAELLALVSAVRLAEQSHIRPVATKTEPAMSGA